MSKREDIDTAILLALITKQNADHFVSQLDDILHSLYNQKSDIKRDLDMFLSYDKKDLLLELFKKHNVSLDNKPDVQKELDSIRQQITSLPIINLHIPFVPTIEFLEQIANWLVVKNQIYTLIDVIYDPSIVGGLVIESNGIYKDFSLRKKLEEFFSAKKIV